jgi:hypothetical protein
MQTDFFWFPNWLEDMGWLPKAEDYTQGILNIPSNISYRPFLLFDLADRYEADIRLMNTLTHGTGNYDQEAEDFMKNGWLLGVIALPKGDQLEEKVKEAMTSCDLARISILSEIFHQKYHRCPSSTTELENACLETWNPIEGGTYGIPPVMVTGNYVTAATSPAGTNVTMAKKGEVPQGSNTGWLFDSNSGSVYVNSTLKDSNAIPYSFYGFQ